MKKEMSIELAQSKIQAFQIKKYILDAIDSEDYGIKTETEQEKITFLLTEFKKEAAGIRIINMQGHFEEWVQGLPSIFNVDYEYSRIIEIGTEWGFLSENSTERQQHVFITTWWARIYMATKAIASKYDLSLNP